MSVTWLVISKVRVLQDYFFRTSAFKALFSGNNVFLTAALNQLTGNLLSGSLGSSNRVLSQPGW